MGLSSFISKRYFFSKSKWNVVNIISQVASFVLVIAICAFFVVLSVFSGLKNFGLNYSKAFDPDIKISHAKLKHFDLSTLPLNKLAALSEIKTFSKNKFLLKKSSQTLNCNIFSFKRNIFRQILY